MATISQYIVGSDVDAILHICAHLTFNASYK